MLTPRLQLLEQRTLLAAGTIEFDSASGTINIVGTELADTLYVVNWNNDVVVLLSNSSEQQTEFFASDLVAGVQFDGLGGDDVFWNGTAVRSDVDGGAGNDTIYGSSSSDFLRGGDGDDVISAGDGNDVLYGQAGNDQLHGEAGVDLIVGDSGADELYGGSGADILLGGDGTDTLFGGDGDDTLVGGNDDDQLFGEQGHDQLQGESGADLLIGGPGDDDLVGGSGADTLEGNDGDDELHGLDGSDTLVGGPGDDQLYGGGGDDLLTGDDGIDHLHGDEDADQLFGGNDDDFIDGGTGDDLAAGGDGADVIYGRLGNDVLHGDAGVDSLFGDAGADELYGGDDADTLLGGDGNDSLFGAGGDDVLWGGNDDDRLFGEQGHDLLVGQAGADALIGGLDDDVLLGGDGDDILDGQQGDDDLRGEAGLDILFGGAGDDRLFGGDGDDLLSGDVGVDHLNGEGGADQIFGGDDRDFAFGGDGDDSIFGGDGSDALLGGAGNDQIHGEADRDLLIGGADADQLVGGSDQDVLIGGETNYDLYQQVAALNRLLDTWTTSESYAARVAVLEDPQQPYYLKSTVTVVDDASADLLLGQDERDWYFLTGDLLAGHFNTPVNQGPAVYGTFWAKLQQLDELLDVQADESIHTVVPHSRNATMRRNHAALFDLVNPTTITHAAVSSGPWSAPSTWSGGTLPTPGAHVRIEPGVTVTIDGELTDAYETVYVGGVLQFDHEQHTHLRVDTLVVHAQGALRIGTAAQPIADHVEARISIVGTGPLDPARDPLALGRGIIAHGTVEIHGAAVTPWLGLAQAPLAGQTQLVLDQVPLNWSVGDTLLLPGTNPLANEDELRNVLSITGNTVTVEPLQYDHVPPSSSLTVHVGNLSRNVVIESEDEATDRRGHVMFMHQRDIQVAYAAVQQMGRTDKKLVADNPVVDEEGNVQPGTGSNPIGRYAVHFHRNGVVNDGNPSLVHGVVVTGSPGWGFVNHSSFVNFSSNIAFQVDGSAFVTEAGDEIGSFTGNLAVRGIGSGDSLQERTAAQDFGHQGDGFWFQGAGVQVEDNVATGQAGHGFVFFTLGLAEGELGVRRFLSSNLPDPSIAAGEPTISVADVPITEFRNNTAYAAHVGVGVLFSLGSATHGQGSLIEDITAWNNHKGIDIRYTADAIVRNAVVVHHDPTIGETGIGSNDVTRSIVYDNVHVEGYLIGLQSPLRGTNVIEGGFFRNIVNVLVETAVSERSLQITGDIDFQSLIAPEYGFDVWLLANLNLTQHALDLQHVFLPDEVLLDYGPYVNQRVYFAEQVPEFTPFPTIQNGVLPQWVGLSGQALFDQFGIRLGDAWAPIDALTDPRIGGLIGP